MPVYRWMWKFFFDLKYQKNCDICETEPVFQMDMNEFLAILIFFSPYNEEIKLSNLPFFHFMHTYKLPVIKSQTVKLIHVKL